LARPVLYERHGAGSDAVERELIMAEKTLLCLACYQNRLASVCENADEYKIFEIRESKSYPAGLLSLPSKDPMDRTSAILACGVTFLLCGAICEETRIRLEQGGIMVFPWLTGTVEQALGAFMGNSFAPLAMPGCRDRFRRNGIRRGRGGCRRGFSSDQVI